jgi:hypothetical protein
MVTTNKVDCERGALIYKQHYQMARFALLTFLTTHGLPPPPALPQILCIHGHNPH